MAFRFVDVIFGVACLPWVACGGGAGSGDKPDAAAPADAAPADASGIITVAGTLTGRAGDNGPLASREVVIIDAKGTVTKVTSDANGLFGATGVVTPYDIGIPYVAEGSGGSQPRYYEGITRPDPTVRGDDYNKAAPPDTTPQSVTVTFTANACVGCTIWFSGPDDDNVFAGTGAASAYVESYRFHGSASHASPFHLYISNAAGVYQSSIDIPMQSFVSGQTVALGTPAFTAIASSSIAITATVPASYTFETADVQFYHPDHSRIGYTEPYAMTAVSTANYPAVDGLIVEIDNTVDGPNVGETTDGDVEYTVPNVASAVTTTLLAAPTLTTPAEHATGVTDAQMLTWSPYGAQTAYQTVLMANVAGGNTGYLIYSASPSVDLSRLTSAEMALAPATIYTWLTVTDGIATIDEVTAPAAPTAPGTVTVYARSLEQTFTTQ